ncbi:MAG: hypothetical protein E6I91_21755 [Chloroflexi bacterium]|nr:MAG: hypothetical protein E6I91_21755 [Chloroflexota bacterium]
MTTHVEELGKASHSTTTSLIGGISFDWLMIAALTWLMAGGYLDAWAHNHFALDTFFTPWHGVLYSGFLVVALVLLATIVLNHAKGATWQKAVPAGYELSVLGVCGFAIGGVADLFWHLLFGIEKNIDAQLSPTHLLLMICWGLIAAGPFRAAWRRSIDPARRTWLTQLTIPISLLLLLSVFSLTTQTAQPLTVLAPTTVLKVQGTEQSFAVLGIVFQSMILIMLILLAVRRWHMPVGSFTLVLTLNAIALSFMHSTFIVIPIAAVAGSMIDLVYHFLQPSAEQVDQFRLFAATVPMMIYVVYFLVLWITMGIVWSVHLSAGSIIVSGIAGWLISYVMIPPKAPGDQATGS